MGIFFPDFWSKYNYKLSVANKQQNDTHLTDMDVVQWVDTMASLFNVLGNWIGHQFVDDFLQIGIGHITCDDVAHLLTNGTHLRVLGVACFALRQLIFCGEANGEHTEPISIGGSDIEASFDQCLPFLNHGTANRMRSQTIYFINFFNQHMKWLENIEYCNKKKSKIFTMHFVFSRNNRTLFFSNKFTRTQKHATFTWTLRLCLHCSMVIYTMHF